MRKRLPAATTAVGPRRQHQDRLLCGSPGLGPAACGGAPSGLGNNAPLDRWGEARPPWERARAEWWPPACARAVTLRVQALPRPPVVPMDRGTRGAARPRSGRGGRWGTLRSGKACERPPALQPSRALGPRRTRPRRRAGPLPWPLRPGGLGETPNEALFLPSGSTALRQVGARASWPGRWAALSLFSVSFPQRRGVAPAQPRLSPAPAPRTLEPRTPRGR